MLKINNYFSNCTVIFCNEIMEAYNTVTDMPTEFERIKQK